METDRVTGRDDNAQPRGEGERPWALELESVPAAQSVETSSGLSAAEVEQRKQRYGANELAAEAPPSLLWRFFAQFKDVTVLALLIAAATAAAMGALEEGDAGWLERYSDSAAILVIVLLNGVIGVVQEGRARSALQALRQLSSPTALVRRGGREQRIDATELVPGDVIVVAEGDRVPADARLIETQRLAVAEAALTGESAPVAKRADVVLDAETSLAERENMLFMSTIVQSGMGVALVTGTGARTEIGSVAAMLESVENEKTPLERQLAKFGSRVAIGCGILAVLTFAIAALTSDEGLAFALLLGVSLAVAAIPEGLPAVTTVVLALGVRKMAAKKAIVRRLSAVEALGSVHVICSDKTGTLTQNQMTVRRLWSAEEGEADAAVAVDAFGRLRFAAQFAPAAKLDDAGKASGEPTDAALLEFWAAHRTATDQPAGDERANVKIASVLPFSSDRKRSSVAADCGQGLQLFTHGAPEEIVRLCVQVVEAEGPVALSEGTKTQILEAVERFSAKGLRVLALAERTLPSADEVTHDSEQGLTFLGLVGMSDPPRSEVEEAVKTALRGGVRTLMITGDHPSTARAIATELGILRPSGSVLTSRELQALSEEELVERCADLDVVARATPADKLRVVRAIERRGDAAAMTGDGVNDAPAIKAAAVGVAMGKGGTDATREVADLVLADDNYATIVVAIAHGRAIYANIQRFVGFLFAVNLGLVLVVFAGMVLGWPPLLTPTQILWINLITNGLPALALGMEPGVGDPMSQPPRARDAPLLGGWAWGRIAVVGAALMTLAMFGFQGTLGAAELSGAELSAAELSAAELDSARTVAFTVLAIGPVLYAFSARSNRSVFRVVPWSNPPLLGAVLVSVLLQGLAVYTPTLTKAFDTQPLAAADLARALGLAALVLLPAELYKLLPQRH